MIGLNIGPTPQRNSLTKQQKAECEAAARGLKSAITEDDIRFTRRLLAQKEKETDDTRN